MGPEEVNLNEVTTEETPVAEVEAPEDINPVSVEETGTDAE